MLSINCKEAGDPNCSHTITGATEQELFETAKKHAIQDHGMTAEVQKSNQRSLNFSYFYFLIV